MRTLISCLILGAVLGCDTEIIELAPDGDVSSLGMDANVPDAESPQDIGFLDQGFVDTGLDAGFVDASMSCTCRLPCRADSDCTPISPSSVCAQGICDEAGVACDTAIDCLSGWVCVSQSLGLCQ